MKIEICENSEELGQHAAAFCADILKKAISEKGEARMTLSTGASQFDVLKALVKQDINWTKVEMFHLDEYMDMPETHPASFRKYLKERFAAFVNLKKIHYVSGEGDVIATISDLTEKIRKSPIDLALIGIGENAHIAFNDPPADFDTQEAYIVVHLDEKCRRQQLGEGWFSTIEDVPRQAISMTVYQIMQSKVIVSFVPYNVKAAAIRDTLENEVTSVIPATMLKMHDNWVLYVDEKSAGLTDKSIIEKYNSNKR